MILETLNTFSDEMLVDRRLLWHWDLSNEEKFHYLTGHITMQMALPPYGKFKQATTAKIKKFAGQSSQENEQLK